jgi:hypothetical protein
MKSSVLLRKLDNTSVATFAHLISLLGVKQHMEYGARLLITQGRK